jgi:spore coat protein SA
VHVLIEAFSEIHRRMPDVQLIIAGSSFFGGAAKTAYEQQLVDLAEHVNGAIIFTGYLPHEKLKYLYSIVDMVVLPSVWQDPCPLVVLEAMSSGTSLVSTAVGGVPEVMESGQTGVLVEPDNPELLAEAIFNTLGDEESLCEMEVNAREKIISGYTWERLVIELESILGTKK